MNRFRPGAPGHVAVAAAGLVAALALAPAAARGAEMSSNVLIYEGMPAPDQPAGTTIRSLGGFSLNNPPVINKRGDIAFWGQLSAPGDPSTGSRNAIFSTGSGSLAPVAVVEQEVPDMPGWTFADFSRRILIDDAGQVAFGSYLRDPDGDIHKSIHAQGPDGLRTVVYEGKTLPQPDPQSPAFGYTFQSLGHSSNFAEPYNGGEFAFAGGRVAFFATAAPPEGDSDNIGNVQGFWSERPTHLPAQLQVLARSGEDTDFSGMNGDGQPVINGHGWSAFRATVTVPLPKRPDVEVGVQSIWSENGGVLTQVVQVPPDPEASEGDVDFTGFGTPSINDNGQAAFTAGFRNLGIRSDTGIWKQMPQTAGVVAVAETVAPGTGDINNDGTPDWVFQSFEDPLINDNGVVAFKAHVAHPDGTEGLQGIWTDRGGALTQLEPVAISGQQAPGLPEGTTFTSIAPFQRNSMALNDRDQVAFVATFQTEGGATGTGIWAEDDGELVLVVKSVFSSTGELSGDTFVLPNGETITVRGLSFAGGSGNSDGRPSGFSDNGELVFLGARSGGVGGGAIISVMVPEPASAALLAAGTVLLLPRRRRR